MPTLTKKMYGGAGAPSTVVCRSGNTYSANANGIITSIEVDDVNDLEQAGYADMGEDQAINKLDATTSPAVTDDSGDGYGVGSLWVDVSGNAVYVCTDATAGAAVWCPMTGAALNVAHTWLAIQTYTNSMLKILGSSTGATTLTSANAGASNYTLTLPAATDTVAVLGTAQAITALKTFSNSMFAMLGSSTGKTTLTSANSGASDYVATLPAATDTIAMLAATQTLTNKTLTNFIHSGCKRVTAQVDLTTSTTLTDITGLAVSLSAAGVYAIRAYIPGTSTGNGGAKFALGTSDTLTATSISATCRNMNGTTINAASTSTTLGAAIGAATAVFTHATIDAVIVVNAAGTLTVQIAQNASHADTTSAYVNGYLVVERIA